MSAEIKSYKESNLALYIIGLFVLLAGFMLFFGLCCSSSNFSKIDQDCEKACGEFKVIKCDLTIKQPDNTYKQSVICSSPGNIPVVRTIP